MGFFCFLGRVLFAAFFLLSAWQTFNEFGVAGGGSATKQLQPKLNVALIHMSSKLGVVIPDVDIRQAISAITALKGFGGLLFVFGSSFGAYLLILELALTAPVLYDFYNYESTDPEFESLLNEFTRSLALFGALLFFIGMKNSMTRRNLKKKTLKTKTT